MGYDCEREPRDVNQKSLSGHRNPNTDTIFVIFFFLQAAKEGDLNCISQWADYVGQLSQDEKTRILDGTDGDGNTALHYLTMQNNSEMVETLICLGAGV